MSTTAEAKALLRQGRVAEAEQLFDQILQGSPDNVEALNAVALAWLRRADSRKSIELLDRAIKLQPGDALSHYHRGRARSVAGDLTGALDSYATAVRLLPDFHVARLHYAETLDRAGDVERAPIQYLRALQDAQQQGHWLDPASTPRGLQPIVTRAVQLVRETRRAMCAQLLEPLQAKFGAAALDRVEEAVRIHIREAVPNFPDPRQQPTFFYVPGLPAAPYLDRQLFPWIEAMEANTAAIQEELLRLLPNPRGRERVFGTTELENVNLRGSAGPPSWNGYYFYRYGVRREDNCQACPITTAALAAVTLCHIRHHAPEVLYSVFTAGTHLLPHRGVTNSRLVAHLPLLIPADCALRVGGDLHVWEEGRIVVFDDTYEHEAWNRSSEIRVVLIFDIWNPHLSEVEQGAISLLVAAMGDFRQLVDQG
jgi:aspartyl/asparaginyl beta-hydroxylase (cupin superfamily)